MSKNTTAIKKTSSKYIIAGVIAILLCVATTIYLANTNKTDTNKNETTSEQKSENKDAYASINKDDITLVKSEGDTIWYLNDSYYFYKTSPIVAIVRIDSIGGGRNFNPIHNQYVSPQTVGRMTIIQPIKGEVEYGEQISYARLGAILPVEDYLKGLSKAEQDKLNHLNKGNKLSGYIKSKFAEDIDIEVDKTYLVFLRRDISKDGKIAEYVMEGMQYGMREVKDSQARELKAGTKISSNIEILNNETGTWEKISTAVEIK